MFEWAFMFNKKNWVNVFDNFIAYKINNILLLLRWKKIPLNIYWDPHYLILHYIIWKIIFTYPSITIYRKVIFYINTTRITFFMWNHWSSANVKHNSIHSNTLLLILINFMKLSSFKINSPKSNLNVHLRSYMGGINQLKQKVGFFIGKNGIILLGK